MEFRPCIDIHNGKVKQIVGSSLNDSNDFAKENFVSQQDASFYANLYKNLNVKGGHVILLNSKDSEFFEDTRREAIKALNAYPGGLQIGGGITSENAPFYLKAGASHVIVTSYVFRDGKIDKNRLEELSGVVGKEHLVLDLSCRMTKRGYVIATNRWQKLTDYVLNLDSLKELSAYCDEFLIHAVDVEGKSNGIEEELVRMLGDYQGIAVTYAGGVHSLQDLTNLRRFGNNRVNITIGSALEIFGGELLLEDILKVTREE